MHAELSSLRWYLVHCRPREEERALAHLGRQGFECFRPMRPVERRREGRRHFVQEALFPRYLFIHLDCVHDNWYPIQSTRGVIQIVRSGPEKPLPVGDEIIEGIRARLTGPRVVEPYLKPGERVVITEGPFAHLEAIFVANDGDERVVLLMTLLNREQRVKFAAEAVRKIA